MPSSKTSASARIVLISTLGFAAFVNGLCLAAIRPRLPDSSAIVPPMIDQPVAKPLPRRSAFANRLHGPEIGAEHDNGSVDR